MTFILPTITKISKAYPLHHNSICLQLYNKPIKINKVYECNLHTNRDNGKFNFMALIISTTPYVINTASKLLLSPVLYKKKFFFNKRHSHDTRD